MDQEYKLRKEAFVANLSGGSITEINLVTLVAPAATLLWSALQSRQDFFQQYGVSALLCDFLLNVGAILFATTAYSDAPVLLNLLLISPAILILLLPKKDGRKEPPEEIKAVPDGKGSPVEAARLPVRGFLTTYRGAMMVVTCVAILAVDFRVFPRRFAKAENWGTSLMDLGVGSFVFSAGVVSSRSVLKARFSAENGKHNKPFLKRLLESVRHSIPLLILGLIRLYTVKGLDYAEHVTEYGVHWNFFFTMALLPPFVELSDLLTTWIVPSYEGIAVLFTLMYEIVLDNTNLKRYILISQRGPDLLSKNREGVFSFIGYLSIFLAGRGIGMRIIPGSSPPAKSVKSTAREESAWRERKSLIQKMAIQSVLWTLLFVGSTNYFCLGLRVSRRLANLPYVLWINAFNNAQLLLFCLIETTFFPEAYKKPYDAVTVINSTSKILQAFNKGGLVIFLLANLLTGAVNLTVKTLDVGSLSAVGILVVYMGTVTAGVMALDRFDIKIKL